MTAPIPSTVSPIQPVLRQSQGQTILVSLQPSASQGVLLHVSPLLLFSDFLTLKMSAVVACCYTQPLYLHRCWGNTVLLKLPPDQFSPVTALLGPLLLPGAPAESSPTPQLKTINSSVFSLRGGSTLTSINDYWKNHSLVCTDLCWESNVSAF